MSSRAKNFLDYIPNRNKILKWERDNKGLIVVFIENKGVFNRLAQLILKKPRVTKLYLDKFGSFIWENIDGRLSIYEIGKLLYADFGDDTEPLYPRLIQFLKCLSARELVEICQQKHFFEDIKY